MIDSMCAQFTLHPDPGPLPTKKPPKSGEKVGFVVDGMPPFKELRASIRNPRHRHYARFTALRAAAIKAMNGRCWYDGPVALHLTMHAKKLDEGKRIFDYLSGVFDTLDGSHGTYFTYLPIVFQDDCQVEDSRVSIRDSEKSFYTVEIKFL